MPTKYYAEASPEKAIRDPQSRSFKGVEIHGKKYNITNYSIRDIFLPMKTLHEWERVICAASQGLKNGIVCNDTSKFGTLPLGFPHENGREATDPFAGKDLNTFEYEKETGPSLGIKIDLIAEWIVTLAPNCPSHCGYLGGSVEETVSCSTGDENDCDPSTKPTPVTTVCGAKVCPTYTGTWQRTSPPSCPTYCGYSGGTRYGSVTCSNNDCDPATRPSSRSRSCSATRDCTGPYSFGSCPSHHGYSGGTINGTCINYDSCTPPSTKPCSPVCKGGSSWNGSSCVCGKNEEWNGSSCVCKDNYKRESVSGVCIETNVAVDCEVSTWGSWTDTSSWGSCSKSCGGGVKTKTQERTRSITTQPENGGEACPALKENRTQKQSCNTQACLSLYKCNGYGSWIKKGTCSVNDYCDHFHTIGETCCSPSTPYGPCQNGPVDG